MKKFVFTAMLLGSFSSYVFAEGLFVAIGVGNIDIENLATVTPAVIPPSTVTDSGGTQYVTIGSYLSDKLMASVSYENINIDTSNTSITSAASTISATVDYLIEMGDAVMPYLGASASFYNHTSSGLQAEGYTNDSLVISSFYVTLDIGFLYELTDTVMLQGVYKFPLLSSNTAGSNVANIAGTDYTFDFETTITSSWNLGFLINF